MTDPTGNGPDRRRGSDRVVYVVEQGEGSATAETSFDLLNVWVFAWSRKWKIIAITAVFTGISIAYALLAPQWYRAEVLLAPAEEQTAPSLGGQLGGLAALAGVSIGGGDSAEAIATLESRAFARAFIEDNDLLPVLFSDDWDASNDRWASNNPEDWPDIRDAVSYLLIEVLSVSEDLQTSLVTLSVDWTDAQVAADWANELVRRLNDRMRRRALNEAEANVAYLQGELAKANVVTLQQSIGRVLESELQKAMLARGNEEFQFRVIDSAVPPKLRIRPQRKLVVVLGTALGGILAVVFLFLAGLRAEGPQHDER